VDTVRYRTRSSVMAFGALIALAGIAGGYFFPVVMKPVETVMGTILTAHFSPAVGKYSLSRQRVGVQLTVDGKPRKVTGSTSAPADIARKFYGVGQHIKVYISQSKHDTYASLALQA
jgi:hypothetical protein